MPTPAISNEAIAALQAYDWPGNVRQLRNIVERTIILAPGEPDRRHRRRHAASRGLTDQAAWRRAGRRAARIMGTPLREARETFEREYLQRPDPPFLRQYLAHREFIGMERSALHRKLKTLGLVEEQGCCDSEE